MNHRDGTQSKAPGGQVVHELGAVRFSRGEAGPKLLEGIRSEVLDVARAVETATGWVVDLSKIRCEGVSSSELARRYAEDVFRRTGVQFVIPSAESSRRAFQEMVASRFAETVAVFLPVEGAILLNEEMPATFTRDSVRSALFHELVHLAQYQRYPEFWSATDALQREAILLSRHGADVPKDAREERLKKAQDRLQARRAFLEGGAAFFQAEYVRTHDLHPAVGGDLFKTVIGEAALLAVGSPTLVAQFVAGALTVKEAYQRDSRVINSIFENPALCEVVFGAVNPDSIQSRVTRIAPDRQSAS